MNPFIGIGPTITRRRGGGVINPLTLPDIEGYWKSSNVSSSGGLISQIDDLSGNTRHATQTNDTYKPTLVSNYANSKPSIYFPTAATHYVNFGDLSLTNFTIHIVFKQNAITRQYHNIISGQTNGTIKGNVWTAGTLAGVDGPGIINADLNKIREANDESYIMKVITYTNSKIYINGSEATYTDTQDIDNCILSRIGARVGSGASTNYFAGYTMELMICSSQHSESNILAFHDYAKYVYNIKDPNGALTEGDRHVDYINGNYQFGFGSTTIFYSSNGGQTWTTQNFANAASIDGSVIFSNGNVFWSRLDKCYKSTDGLQTYTEVTALDKNGDPWTPGINASVFKKSADIGIFTEIIDGVSTEMAVWGTYANVISGEDDSPINIYRMFNDCIPKITYTFGVNPVYPDAGDAGNSVICRHCHNITKNTVNGEYIITTGDFAGARPWLKGVYNTSTDAFVWTVITNSPAVALPANTAAVWYQDGYLYFADDESFGRLYRCLWADIEDTTKHELLARFGNYFYNVRINSDGTGIGVGLSKIYTTQNFFRNYKEFTIDGFTGDYLKLNAPSGNIYKVEKYTPPNYNTNSIYVTIVKT